MEAARRGTNGSAIASLVLGVVGVMGFMLVSPLALYFGYRGRREIDTSGGAEDGRGLAVAGIVLGWVGTALLILAVLVFLLVVVAFVASDSIGFSA